MIDARLFNIRDEAGRLLCPACGYPDYTTDPAYDERGALIGITVCPCCLWEPGFDDNHHASAAARDTIVGSLRAYRTAWGTDLLWQGLDAEMPEGWDARQQLNHLFELAPHVR